MNNEEARNILLTSVHPQTAEEAEVIGVAVTVLERMAEHDALYLCDPEKNTECPKTHCHINGGDCRLTTHRKYRRKK